MGQGDNLINGDQPISSRSKGDTSRSAEWWRWRSTLFTRDGGRSHILEDRSQLHTQFAEINRDLQERIGRLGQYEKQKAIKEYFRITEGPDYYKDSMVPNEGHWRPADRVYQDTGVYRDVI